MTVLVEKLMVAKHKPYTLWLAVTVEQERKELETRDIFAMVMAEADNDSRQNDKAGQD